MIKKITLATTLMAALLSGNAMAQDDINPWKHCGIGAMIFDDNGAAAAISNIIWDLGTTALSTKISSAEDCKGKRATVAMFIQNNFDQVVEQTSQGSGEHLIAMLQILEISQELHNPVIAEVRSNLVNTMAKEQLLTAESYYQAVIAAI